MAHSKPSGSWPELLGTVRVLLEARIAEGNGKASNLSLALSCLDQARTLIEAELARPPERALRREARTGDRVTGYHAEDFGGREVLVERRGDSEPFRCPKDVFDAVVKYAGTIGRPFDFMEMFETLRQKMSGLPDYRPRVCVRFMVKEGLLSHERRRFRASHTGKEFAKVAAAAWERARQAGRRA